VRAALERLQARLLARARLSPAPDAVALVVGRQSCGSMSPAVAQAAAGAVPGFTLHDGMLELDDAGLDLDGRSERLEALARMLLRAGYSQAWRDETLEVRATPESPALARIDRSAVRVLGITTYSVHLNAFCTGGRMVVAQRAAHKRVDPGLWDNLAGGMITAGEAVHLALAREAYEEAGLELDGLPLVAGARIAVRRPIAEGVLAEIVHVFDVALPADVQPVNRDGEVARFETRSIADVVAAMERDEFTVEAALATLDALLRRGF